MKWDVWIGKSEEEPTFWIKWLVHLWGRRIDLHKMVAADDAACFHTHPALAFRVVLWGGYVEEMEDGTREVWSPGRMGLVRPALCHRIHALSNGRVSYSLWFRGRCDHPIELRGGGWPESAEKRADGINKERGHTGPEEEMA